MDLYTFPPEVGSNALLLPSATAPMIATPYDENHLVVGPLDSGDHDYKHYYWLYKVESNSWTVCPESPSLFQSVGSPVKVGNTLYYRCGSTSDYIDGDICALDLESGIYYRGPVRWKAINHKVVTVNSGEHALFHLGGNDFCYCTIHKHSHVFCPDYPHIPRASAVPKSGLLSEMIDSLAIWMLLSLLAYLFLLPTTLNVLSIHATPV